MTAAAIPEERALRAPGEACIADQRQELDNQGFALIVAAVAGRLAAAGLSAGDVLAIMVPNRVELVTSMFAAWRLGAAVTPVNAALTTQEARYQIDDAGTAVVVADGASAEKLAGGGYHVIPVDEVTSPARLPVPPPANPAPESLALLIYTSGTTGRPKGVMLDHANISATAERIVDWFGMADDTRSLLVLPLFHVNGIMVSVVSPLLAGGSAGIAERVQAGPFSATVEQGQADLLLRRPHHLRDADVPAGRAARPAQPALRHLRGRADAAPADRRVRGA